MKVPKHIQNTMHRIAVLGKKMSMLSKEVDDWFESKGFEVETLRSGNGFSLEELEYGNDITEDFVSAIEKGDYSNAPNKQCRQH